MTSLDGADQAARYSAVARLSASISICPDLGRILRSFESLGESCDFGFVQRAVGVEGFGLLRFAGCTATAILDLLRSRMQYLAADGDLSISSAVANAELLVRSESSDLEIHTFQNSRRKDAATVLKHTERKLRFQKAQLMRDMKSGDKLFVLAGSVPDDLLRAIAEQLRRYGPNQLLAVGLADDDHPAALVERAGEDFLRGYISRFGTYYNGPSLPMQPWIALCLNAYRLWHGAEPPTCAVDNLLRHEPRRWHANEAASIVSRDSLGLYRQTIMEHRIRHAGEIVACAVDCSIAVAGPYVFSVWVYFPPKYRGGSVRVDVAGQHYSARQDANASMHGTWQQIWVCGSLLTDAAPQRFQLLVSGPAGEVFKSTEWCVQAGHLPSSEGYR